MNETPAGGFDSISMKRGWRELITPGHGADAGALGQQQAARLLKMGISGPRRSVDDLITRLEAPDSEFFFRSLMRTGLLTTIPRTAAGAGADALCKPGLTIEQLTEVKDQSKNQAATSKSRDDYLAGVAAYYLSIAAALAHHGRLISATNRREMNDALLDLAASVPEPWADLLAQGALAPAPPTT